MFQWKKISIFLILFQSVTLGSSDTKQIDLTGKVVEVFSDGKERDFVKKDIFFTSKNSKNYNERIDGDGFYTFKYINKFFLIGEEIQLKVTDKNWFILSPYNGRFFVPNKTSNIKIKLISKKSKIYLDLFLKISAYSVQVLSTSSEVSAKKIVYLLRKDGYNPYIESRLTHVLPKNKYIYKVKVDKFMPHEKDKAYKLKNELSRRYSKTMKKSFVTVYYGYRKID